MTGRDLIIYILENGLEDEPVFKDGKFIGFITTGEAAVQCNVLRGERTYAQVRGDNLYDGSCVEHKN